MTSLINHSGIIAQLFSHRPCERACERGRRSIWLARYGHGSCHTIGCIPAAAAACTHEGYTHPVTNSINVNSKHNAKSGVIRETNMDKECSGNRPLSWMALYCSSFSCKPKLVGQYCTGKFVGARCMHTSGNILNYCHLAVSTNLPFIQYNRMSWTTEVTTVYHLVISCHS